MKRSTTKNALLMSALSLFLCFAMLTGTTFAWFTDTVESGVNQIVAGNLDVELYYDGNQQVKGDTKLFNDVKFWEPGAAVYENLTVANEGNLALKYQLSVNIGNATGDENLADVLKVGVVPGGIKAGTTRENAVSEVSSWMPFTSFVEAGKLQPKDAAATEYPSTTYGIVIWWEPSDIDNNYNMNNGEADLTIDIGVKLFATQLMAEEDSFGSDYDENAPFSVWNGTVPATMPETLVVDGATQTIHVKDAAAFAYLSTLSAKWAELYTDGNGRDFTNYANGAGGDYYYSNKWTVSLEADIDLGNHPIAPVDIKLGESTGASAFDGKGHTIRNINATTGLFADNTRATFSNFTLENVKATRGALAGGTKEPVKNVTVKNATISGTNYVGGLVGSAYSSITGCKVIDSSVVATGKEAGGMIGYIETSTTATVAYNTVNNVNVYAGNRAAGLVAQVNVDVKVHNNVIDTVTVGAADTSSYQPGAVVSNALDAANVYDNTVKNANVATKAAAATDSATLDTAIADGADTVFLGSGNYIIPDSASNKTLTIVGNGDTIIANQNDGSYEGCDYSLDGATVVFENVTINTDGHTYAGYARCNATYNNCIINGSYTLYGESEFNNCTFNVEGDYYNIWTWGGKTVKFNGCTFNTDGKSILVYNQSCDVYVNDCVFNDRTNGTGFTKSALETGVDGVGPKYNIYINNTTFNGFAENDKCVGYKNIVGNKNSLTAEYLNVVIDGVDVH